MKRRISPAVRRRVLLSFALILCCVASVGVRADDAADIKAKLEAIRKAGEPTTGEELDKWYPEPPVGQNAAQAIMKAFAKMRLDGLSNAPTLPALGKGRLPEQGAVLPPEVKTSDMTVVANNREALESLHQSLKGRQCRYPVDLKNGFFDRPPHLAEVKHGVELLELGAVVADEEGQTAKAAVCME